jgi:hypothetical protein
MRHRLVLSIALAAVLAATSLGELAAADRKRANAIKVIEATYGGNCPGVTRGNATGFVAKACDGKDLCNYRVYYKQLGGDPAAGCDKDFKVSYICGRYAARNSCALKPEAGKGGEEGYPNQFCLLHCLATGQLLEPASPPAGDGDDPEAVVGSIEGDGSVTPVPPAPPRTSNRPAYRYRVERLPNGRFQVSGPFREPW